MTLATLMWGSPAWGWTAVALLLAGMVSLGWGYWRAGVTSRAELAALVLKGIGITGLALCLIEPLLSGTRARSGANMFAVVVDNSQSMTIHNRGETSSRGHALQALLGPEAPWQIRLREDFDARRFAFDSQLRSVADFEALQFDGQSSSLHSALESLSQRFQGLPLAGVLLMTDGNATDTQDIAWNELPPIYPVAWGSDEEPADLRVAHIAATQTNFESAPVVVRADIEASGRAGAKFSAMLLDENGRELQSQTAELPGDGGTLAVRFDVRPEKAGVNFYTVKVGAANAGDAPERFEATLANNQRQVVVDRGGGPYRVLYVGGRPNWEFKFLRRALADDEQLALVGLVRIARREPKFAFRRHAGESTNPLFSGFEHPDEESAERFDQPVLVRLGTKDDLELRGGFPKSAEELYPYDAVILDDVESGYFTQDQLALVKNFVSRRGGGLLMLGGPDSLAAGKYDRTPIGSVLPVYCSSVEGDSDGEKRDAEAGASQSPFDSYSSFDPPRPEHEYRLSLTREGWLQPWVRTRKTEPEERERLASMSKFQVRSNVGGIKPAANVLAEVVDEAGKSYPALVTQRFGRGRSAALTIGDMWRWGLSRQDNGDSDLEKAWRQTVRWLVADVPRRVEVDVRSQNDEAAGAIELRVRLSDAEYLPLDNAQLAIEVTTPDGRKVPLDAEPCDDERGAYKATHVPRRPGAYRAKVVAKAADGSLVGEREAGWVAQLAADEFKQLRPNRAALADIAKRTGGDVVESTNLDRFVKDLPNRKSPVMEPWIRPAWHHPLFYLTMITCLCGEWGLRRWRGLP